MPVRASTLCTKRIGDSQSVKVITLGNIFRIQRVQPVMDACGNNNRIPKMRAVLLLNCSASGPQLRRRQQNGVSHCLHVLKRFPSLLFRKAGGFQFSRRRNELATHLPKQRRRHGRLDQLLRNLLLLSIARIVAIYPDIGVNRVNATLPGWDKLWMSGNSTGDFGLGTVVAPHLSSLALFPEKPKSLPRHDRLCGKADWRCARCHPIRLSLQRELDSWRFLPQCSSEQSVSGPVRIENQFYHTCP